MRFKIVTLFFSSSMLKRVHSFADLPLPSCIPRTGCYRCNILLAMEDGLLHVDALDRDGRHFLYMCPEHMLGKACRVKEFATRMWALKPCLVLFWKCFPPAPRRWLHGDYKSMETLVLTCEQLWVDLTLVRAEWSPAVKNKLEERKTWNQGLRRAWIAATVSF